MMAWNDSIKDPEKEKLQLEKLIKENPDDAEAHYKLAEVYGNMNDNDKAIECCEKAISLNPYNSLYFAFFFFLNHNFNQQKAFDALVEFIELVPDEGDCYTERVIDELGCVDSKFALEYIAKLRTQDKEYVAHTIERWIWNP